MLGASRGGLGVAVDAMGDGRWGIARGMGRGSHGRRFAGAGVLLGIAIDPPWRGQRREHLKYGQTGHTIDYATQ